MGDRDVHEIAFGVRRREGRARVLDPETHVVAAEAQVSVADQRAGQEVRLAQHLEPVADPQREPPAAREVDHLAHDRAEAGDRPGPQVVPVGEPAREHDDIGASRSFDLCHR